MTEKQKPAGDEPMAAKPAETSRNQQKERKSTKSEVVKAEVVARRCQGESKASIAREVGIDRSTVDHILEESADDITRVILEGGLNHKELVNNHLKPLLGADKGGLYGGADNATRLRTIKYINELKGVRPKRADGNGHQTAGVTIRLDLSPGEEAKVAAVISGRRNARQPGVGAPVHENRG